MCSPRIDWWPRLGQKSRWRGCSTAAGGGSRGGAVSGEDAARGAQGVSRGCRASAREVPSNSHGTGDERSKVAAVAQGVRRRTGGRMAGTARLEEKHDSLL
jgi:hypothetical protein